MSARPGKKSGRSSAVAAVRPARFASIAVTPRRALFRDDLGRGSLDHSL